MLDTAVGSKFKKEQNRLKGISLFANVGIGEIYFKDLGINICVANELINERAKFYQEIYPDTKMICGDFTNKSIQDKLVEEYIKNDCQFLIATPPCQGMSLAGKKAKDDKRNLLIIDTVEFIKKVKPKYILIENVPQILRTFIITGNQKILIPEYIEQELRALGYRVKYDTLDAADYKTPQHRKRAIFLITHQDFNWKFPKKNNHITVEESIGNLPSLEAGERSDILYHYAKKHPDRQIRWMKNTPTGKTALDNLENYPIKDGRKIKGFKTTYKRIDWNRPSPTITMANGSISSQNNVHPGRLKKDNTYSDSRVLSLLEIFRLTGIPDNWIVPCWASEILIRKVVGESFPPKFAKEIVKMIEEIK